MKIKKGLINLELITRLWYYLNKKRKKNLIILFIVMILSGILEIFTLSILFPFLIAIIEPDKLLEFKITKYLFNFFGISSTESILIPLTFLFILAVSISASVRLINLWLNSNLVASIGSDLSNKVYNIYLEKNYEFHVNNNSSKLITNITSIVDGSITFLNSYLFLGTAFFTAFGIVITIFFINWFIAISTISTIGFSYLILANSTKNKLKNNGEKIVKFHRNLIKTLQEGLGAIREVIINSSQITYSKIHKKNDQPLRKSYAQNQFLEAFPRVAMEAVGLFIIAFIALIMTITLKNNATLLPILGTFALGAQKLLPAIQQIYANWAISISYSHCLKEILNIFDEEEISFSKIEYKKIPQKSFNNIVFKNIIEFKNINFSYKNGPEIIKNLNLIIKKGERIGIVGRSGSGKSTLTDILMGLLVPKKGELKIDSININKSSNQKYLYAWRKSLASIPQNIFLTDSTISENIAFGLRKDEIDFRQLERVAEQACILEFIKSTPNGFNTIVGERGVKLSGGQRQRLGIARALYKKPKIIIFDEATSSLDYQTEKEIITTINNLSRDLTLIIVAHRLSTTKNCDRIIKIDKGLIVEEL